MTLPSLSDALAASAIVAGAAKLLPFVGLVRPTVGGTLAGPTLIATGDDVVTPPRSSVARAVSVYEPAATLLHVIPYGAILVTPTTVPFLQEFDFRHRSARASFALAVMAIVAGAVKFAPFTGAVKLTVGGTLGPLTVMARDVDVE